MTRLIPLAVIAAALAACTTPPPQSGPAPGVKVVTNVHPYVPGNGVVQSVSAAPVATASAGSTSEPMQRLEIKMDNGTIQYVDTSSREFTKGTRVSLSQDRFIKKL